MLNKIIFVMLLVLVAPLRADYQCNVVPQDDIHIKAQQVDIYGASGTMMITPDGGVVRNGTRLELSNDAREKAKAYQASLRKDLPYIYKGANEQIDDFHKLLDSVLAKKLNNNSKTRANLLNLKQQLVAQLNKVLKPTNDGMIFDHQAIKLVERESKTLIQQGLGAIVQDSINEMGTQGLQGLLGGLDDLQGSLQKAWKTQQQKSMVFAGETCNRVKALEDQRQAMLRAFP